MGRCVEPFLNLNLRNQILILFAFSIFFLSFPLQISWSGEDAKSLHVWGRTGKEGPDGCEKGRGESLFPFPRRNFLKRNFNLAFDFEQEISHSLREQNFVISPIGKLSKRSLTNCVFSQSLSHPRVSPLGNFNSCPQC